MQEIIFKQPEKKMHETIIEGFEYTLFKDLSPIRTEIAPDIITALEIFRDSTPDDEWSHMIHFTAKPALFVRYEKYAVTKGHRSKKILRW